MRALVPGVLGGFPPNCLNLHDHIVNPPMDTPKLVRNINVYELFAVLAALKSQRGIKSQIVI